MNVAGNWHRKESHILALPRGDITQHKKLSQLLGRNYHLN